LTGREHQRPGEARASSGLIRTPRGLARASGTGDPRQEPVPSIGVEPGLSPEPRAGEPRGGLGGERGGRAGGGPPTPPMLAAASPSPGRHAFVCRKSRPPVRPCPDRRDLSASSGPAHFLCIGARAPTVIRRHPRGPSCRRGRRDTPTCGRAAHGPRRAVPLVSPHASSASSSCEPEPTAEARSHPARQRSKEGRNRAFIRRLSTGSTFPGG
jgi:hypothetical protein